MSPGGKAPARSNLSVGSAGAGAPGLSPCPGLDRAAPPSPRRDPSTLPWTPLPPLWVRMGPSGPSRGGLAPTVLGQSLVLPPSRCSRPVPDWTQHPGPVEDRTQHPALSQTTASRPPSFVLGPHSLCQGGRAVDAEGHGDGEQGRGEHGRHGGELHPQPGRHRQSPWTLAPLPVNRQRP